MLSKEILLYFEQQFDIRLILETREDIIALINLRFAKLSPTKHLRVYGVSEENLYKYKATKSRRKSKGYVFNTEPTKKLRLVNEEIEQDDELYG